MKRAQASCIPLPLHELRPTATRRRLILTQQREAIWRAFSGVGSTTAQELEQSLRPHKPDLCLTAVYRTLHFFCKTGLAKCFRFGRRAVYVNLTKKPCGAYLVCTACGAVLAWDHSGLRRGGDLVAQQQGFLLQGLQFEAHGVCGSCQKIRKGQASSSSR